MVINDPAGQNRVELHSDAVAQAFHQPGATFSHHEARMRLNPGGKGVGKGLPAWVPQLGWDMYLRGDVDAAGGALVPASYEVFMSQGDLQILID